MTSVIFSGSSWAVSVKEHGECCVSVMLDISCGEDGSLVTKSSVETRLSVLRVTRCSWNQSKVAAQSQSLCFLWPANVAALTAVPGGPYEHNVFASVPR